MIIRLVKSQGKHHVLAVDDNGRVIHKKFSSEERAKTYIHSEWNYVITKIDLDNHLGSK